MRIIDSGCSKTGFRGVGAVADIAGLSADRRGDLLAGAGIAEVVAASVADTAVASAAGAASADIADTAADTVRTVADTVAMQPFLPLPQPAFFPSQSGSHWHSPVLRVG